MNNFVAELITFGVIFTIVAILNDLTQVGEAQNVDRNESFLTYNNTAYGISIEYPSNWQIDESANELLISILQNLTSNQMTMGEDSNAIKSKISEVLDTFGLETVSDMFSLSPDKKAEVLQKILQQLNEGTAQAVIFIFSPPENELDAGIENLNIVAENISAASPISLSEYVNGSIEGLKMIASNLTILQPPTDITIDGKPAMTFVYTATNPADESTNVKILNAVAINENIAYVLTFTSNPETYSAYLPTFEKMLQSFKISD